MSHSPPIPESKEALLERSLQLVGCRLEEINRALERPLGYHKGVMGQIIESYLGVPESERCLKQPDFQALGVEVKTLPVRRGRLRAAADWRPQESTSITTLTQSDLELPWLRTSIAAKLQQVLWIPIAVDMQDWGRSRVGQAQLLSVTVEETRVFEKDWDEIRTFFWEGAPTLLTAHVGQWLQVRPKGANSRKQQRLPGSHPDDPVQYWNPKGLYLKTTFTRRLLQLHWNLRSF